MTTVNVREAKTHLSQLLAQVESGEDVIIARAGRPVARLTRFKPTGRKRVFGRDRGKLDVPADFDDPLPDEIMHAFHAEVDPS